VLLTLVLIALIAIVLLLWFKSRAAAPLTAALPFVKLTARKLTAVEREAAQYYLTQYRRLAPANHASLTSSPLTKLALVEKNDNVYSTTHAITRYGVASDEPNKWRYYIDTEEVHLPPFWEPYITTENHVELIKTQSLPLVISLNGYRLQDHHYEPLQAPATLIRNASHIASIRKDEREHIELTAIRKETPEEHKLNRSNGIAEMSMVSIALLLLFFSLNSPVLLVPWLIGVALLLVLWGCWQLLRTPAAKRLKEIHSLQGTPKRWGLFGEPEQGNMNTISLGAIDLVYPPHWAPYVAADLDKPTNIDIYLNRQVVRQGRFLSLHDEVKNFPLQYWQRNALLAASSLLILILMLASIPLSLPMQMSMAWFKGVQGAEVSQVKKLEATPLQVGDTLDAHGRGMCAVAMPTGDKSFNFSPFDCSGIYWNSAAPLPIPTSEVIDRASALLSSVNQQLHQPKTGDQSVNPQLASAIEKSGMILVNDFADIVIKTEALCSEKGDCGRLKNALVNLGNAKDWNSLIKRANAGSLQGTNVLLRPVSADSLDQLVNNATSSFINNEIQRATQSLNSPPPGGFFFRSDEGKSFVASTAESKANNSYNALGQWNELQRLSTQLLDTPFSVRGVVTSITTDANSTRHITLQVEPDIITQWRYLGTNLLLLLVVVLLINNTRLSIKRWRNNRHRLQDIQRYYNSCFGTPHNSLPLN